MTANSSLPLPVASFSTRPTASAAPLHLTIRFSNSNPDIDIDAPNPETTSVLYLKHLLRQSTGSRSRIRLIHQGRLLSDTAALSTVLKAQHLPPPPPSDDDVLGKGKGKARAGSSSTPLQELRRIYINCSIGDELTPEDLAAEEAAAELPPSASPASSSPTPKRAAAPRPLGFDRLLSSGFSPSEVSTLRSQFTSIHTSRYASDSLPSPDTLRSMEDAWIDSNAGEIPTTAARAFEDEGSNMDSVLDVLIKGMMIGFFFPLGSMAWLLRQEGLWSEKWQIFVGSGVVLSLTVGVVMGLSGTQ